MDILPSLKSLYPISLKMMRRTDDYQLHPQLLRVLQLFGIFPFLIISSGHVIKYPRLVLLVLSFISVFYVLFYISAYKAYLTQDTPKNLWGFLSTFRIYISVIVLNFTIAWNLIRQEQHKNILFLLKELGEKVEQIDPLARRDDRIYRKTFRNFLLLTFFDWFINAPLVIYTNTFNFDLWPSLFWTCVTFQNHMSNVLILYVNHLTKVILHSVLVLHKRLQKDQDWIDGRMTLKIITVYEDLIVAVTAFKSMYGPVILLNFAYDFVFIVSQFFLTTFFIINDVGNDKSLTGKEMAILLRSIVFIMPNLAKLVIITYTMERITKEVRLESIYFFLLLLSCIFSFQN